MVEAGLYKKRAAVGIGASQLVLGLFTMIIGGQAVGYQVSFAYTGYGLWGGFVAMVSGVLTICTGAGRREGLIYFNVGVSFFELIVSLVVIAMAIISLVYPATGSGCFECPYPVQDYQNTLYLSTYCSWWVNGPICVSNYEILWWDTLILISLGVLSGSLAITTAALACSCCRLRRTSEVAPQRNDDAESIPVIAQQQPTPAQLHTQFVGVIPAAPVLMAGAAVTSQTGLMTTLTIDRDQQTEQIESNITEVQTDTIQVYSIHIQTNITGDVISRNDQPMRDQQRNGDVKENEVTSTLVNLQQTVQDPEKLPKWLQYRDKKDAPTWNLTNIPL